jgi:hypothetical protein
MFVGPMVDLLQPCKNITERLGQSPRISTLSAACTQFECKVCDDGFLGMGKKGRVFKVTNRNDQIFALKISLDDIEAEHEKIVHIGSADECTIQSASDFLKVGDGGGYLMTPVGSPVNIDVAEDRKALFVMLCRLHHKGFAHGDPRWQNIIRSEGNLLWIDFDNFVLSSTLCNKKNIYSSSDGLCVR